jgi:hypothetical protein
MCYNYASPAMLASCVIGTLRYAGTLDSGRRAGIRVYSRE